MIYPWFQVHKEMPSGLENSFFKCSWIWIQTQKRSSTRILRVQLVSTDILLPPLWSNRLNVKLSFSDTENIRFVFAAVKDTILQSNLKEYNLV